MIGVGRSRLRVVDDGHHGPQSPAARGHVAGDGRDVAQGTGLDQQEFEFLILTDGGKLFFKPILLEMVGMENYHRENLPQLEFMFGN